MCTCELLCTLCVCASRLTSIIMYWCYAIYDANKLSCCSTSRFRWRFSSSWAKRNQSCRLNCYCCTHVPPCIHSLFCSRRCWHLWCAAFRRGGAPLWDETRLRLPCEPTYYAQAMTKARRSASGWDNYAYHHTLLVYFAVSYKKISPIFFFLNDTYQAPGTWYGTSYQTFLVTVVRGTISDVLSLTRILQ